MRALAMVLLPVLGLSQTLSQGERDRALSELYATRKQFLDSVAGLTPAQWSFKPDANTWSVAQCAEHIAVSEDMIFDLIAKKILASPAQPEKRAEVKGKDEAVLKQIPDRTERFKAPEMLAPTGRWTRPGDIVEHFRQSRDRALEYVRTTKDPLRVHFAPHPVVGLLDGYQWILLNAAHSARHVAQIEEVKARPAFPRK